MSEARSFKEVYQQAKSEVLVLRQPMPGLIWAEGSDRLDLLNRMSTNQVDQLAAGTQRTTVLTNAVGQTVDRIDVLALENRLIIVTSPGKGEDVLSWLSGYIFFQDDVTLALFEDDWSLWGMFGPKAKQAATDFVSADAPGEEQVSTFEGGYAWPADPRMGTGVQLLLDPGATARAVARWPDRHPESVEGQVFDVLRVERGVPAMGREILADTIPLEAGLRDAVSFTKGCYIGQEIIARLESRGRLAKQLCGVRLDGQASAPMDLYQSGRRIGRLSSVADSPSMGWIGLALAKPSALETESGHILVGEDDQPGRLVALPFESALT
jgi:folate-binding protein YgfZ